MKKIVLSVAAFMTLTFAANAQAPEAFKYQAVVRNASNMIVTNQAVGMQLIIHQGTATGTAVYTETFAPTTNAYGLVNLEIGTGTTSDNFSMIDWSAGPYFIETAADLTGGTSYNSMGTSQLMSVPYALYAKNVENDMVNDADADSTNELNSSLALNGAMLELTDNGGMLMADLSSLIDADADSTNELQTLSLVGNDLTISNGNTITLPTPTVPSDVNGTTDYVVKFTSATTGGNSMMRDNGTSMAINAAPSVQYQLYTYRQQLTANGDGQHTSYAYRTRDSGNDGTAYGYNTTNTASAAYNYWGDVYTFGVGGFSYNDYTRTGGVLGAYQAGTYWGSLGYKNSGSTTYGVYGSAGYASGAGYLPSSDAIGIGGGFFGELIGSTSQGNVIGQLNSGDLFAQYNRGNVYTKGKNVELVEANGTVTPVYAVTSTEATVYAKGSIQLVNGQAHVAFDSKFAMLLGETPVVTVSPNGECNGLYIASVDAKGFVVKELMNGTSSANISWIAVGNRMDENPVDKATAIVTAPNFDRNVEQVLYSDGHLEGAAQGIWWDGSDLQFGTLPAHLSTVKRSAE